MDRFVRAIGQVLIGLVLVLCFIASCADQVGN